MMLEDRNVYFQDEKEIEEVQQISPQDDITAKEIIRTLLLVIRAKSKQVREVQGELNKMTFAH